MDRFDTDSILERDMEGFIEKFEMFDRMCFKHGFETTSENIELFKAYVTTIQGDD